MQYIGNDQFEFRNEIGDIIILSKTDILTILADVASASGKSHWNSPLYDINEEARESRREQKSKRKGK